MKKLVSLLITFFALTGCATYQDSSTINETDKLYAQLDSMTQSKTVEKMNVPYLGGTSIVYDPTGDILNQKITIKREGDLTGIAQSLSSVSTILVHVEKDSPFFGFDRMIPLEAKNQPLKDILNLLEGLTGIAWYYDEDLKIITFSYYRTKTFTVLTAPGAFAYESVITNQSKSAPATSALGAGSDSSSESQSTQQNSVRFTSDPMSEVENAIKNTLSKDGKIIKNLSAGTITVTDTARNMRVIEKTIKELNSKLEKQVAISVKVYSYELNENASVDFNLKGVLKAGGIKFSAGSSAPENIGGGLSALVISGSSPYSGSELALSALSAKGNATLVASGTGVTLNNQPYPLQSIRKDAYLASVSTQNGDYGQQVSINPGEVTQGYSMTVIPHILDNRKVILQYNLNLSSLDDMDEFVANNIKIQLPKVSTKNFSQRVVLNMGETLVLAGFAQDLIKNDSGYGLINYQKNGSKIKSVIVIVIEVESIGNPITD